MVTKIKNKTKSKPEQAQVMSAIKTPQQVYRTTIEFNKYRNAVLAAENLITPIRYPLYQLYNMTMLDPHITACIEQRKNLILGCDFIVVDKSRKENEEKTLLIKKKWFREFISYSLDSTYWGHSLIQFEDIITRNGIDEFRECELVPRQYVKPEFHFVMSSIASLPPDGIDYTTIPYSDWCVPVGKSRDLGLLLKLTPLYIWKKNALGAWAEFIEKFGSPVRVGKTDSTDLESVNNMESMLKNMGTAAWGLFKTDDVIEFIESKHSDAFMVFDKMIERCNSEISKLILGQTMTTDNGSSRSQAEVHERVLEQAAERDEQFIYSVLNDQLVPLMNALGFGLDGFSISIKQDDELTLKEKGLFDIELIKTGKYIMSPEYIKEKYGTEVIPVEAEPIDETSLKNYKTELSKYY